MVLGQGGREGRHCAEVVWGSVRIETLLVGDFKGWSSNCVGVIPRKLKKNPKYKFFFNLCLKFDTSGHYNTLSQPTRCVSQKFYTTAVRVHHRYPVIALTNIDLFVLQHTIL